MVAVRIQAPFAVELEPEDLMSAILHSPGLILLTLNPRSLTDQRQRHRRKSPHRCLQFALSSSPRGRIPSRRTRTDVFRTNSALRLSQVLVSEPEPTAHPARCLQPVPPGRRSGDRRHQPQHASARLLGNLHHHRYKHKLRPGHHPTQPHPKSNHRNDHHEQRDRPHRKTPQPSLIPSWPSPTPGRMSRPMA